MSDEEDESMSEGFSASEEEWKPNKDVKDGESSDDDDSDFEDFNKTGQTSNRPDVLGLKKSSKLSGVGKQHGLNKKRKPGTQSLRAKLYNKYRPPPKTISSPTAGNNSPSASTSKAKPKNYQTPNQASEESDSGDSVLNYLVHPDDIDHKNTYYDNNHVKKASPIPEFDCNAGIKNLSDSDSEDNNDTSNEDENCVKNAFNFRNLLENAKMLESREENAKIAAANAKEQISQANTDNIDALLALGEQKNEPETSRLNKTKSTRVKKHTKTRPASTVADIESDDSEWEEVAGRKRH